MRRWVIGLCTCLGVIGGGAVRAPAAPPGPQPVYYIGTRQKAVALTFDVSWGERMLPLVLKVLRETDQTATFFLSGPWADTHPEMVRQLIAGGYEIGSHGQQHVNLSQYGPATIAANISAAGAILQGYTGKPLRFFRPPNGDFSPGSIEVAQGLGYETVLWSVDSRDWMNPGVGEIVSRVARQVFPGAILLFHASDTCKQTDLALPTVIADLRAQGYRLVTLGQLWQMGPAMHGDPRGSRVKPNTGVDPSSAASVSSSAFASA